MSIHCFCFNRLELLFVGSMPTIARLTERPEDDLLEARIRRGESRAVSTDRDGEKSSKGNVGSRNNAHQERLGGRGSGFLLTLQCEHSNKKFITHFSVNTCLYSETKN